MCLDSDTVVLRHMERSDVETAPGQAPVSCAPLLLWKDSGRL